MTAVQPVEVPIPKTLYKYLPPERIDILESSHVRFSRPSEFNDTFDSQYLVPASQGSMGISARMRLRSKVGIFCLTERSDNHLMWVHYARNHTGFILGFNAHASFFTENSRRLEKVKYQKGPKVLSEADASVCFYKAGEWEYEQEWRCVSDFKTSDSRLVDFEPTLITEIILGSKMDSWETARILQTTNALNMDVQFFLSSPSHKNWVIENIPKKMTLCSQCDGFGFMMQNRAITDR